MPKYKMNKKAQIGTTIGWIVATIIIIGILLIFIYISLLMSKVKAITLRDLSSEGNKINILELKTSYAHHLANNRNKEIIDDFIKENDG